MIWLHPPTDNGIVGLGETFWAPERAEVYLHANAAPYLLGKDPRGIELHDRMLGNVYVDARDSGAELRGNSAIKHCAMEHLYAFCERTTLA